MENIQAILETVNQLFLILPLSILLLTVLGVLWAPFAAGLCALVAWLKGLDVKPHAAAGAKLSMMLILPWFYLLLRLIVPKKVLECVGIPFGATVYLIIYMIWIVGYVGIFNVLSAILSVRDIFWTYEEPPGILVAFTVIVAILLPINLYTIWCSMRRLIYRYTTNRRYPYEAEMAIFNFDYLTPFIGLIGWSFTVFVTVTIFGLAAYAQG